MAGTDARSTAGQAGDALAEVPLSQLLGGIIDGLLRAQDQLDRHAAQQATQFADTPAGTLAMPPLWFAFRDVRVDLEMSASVAAAEPQGAAKKDDRVFLCRLVNPASVSLFGYQASAGLRISLQLGVMGAVPMKTAPAPDAPSA